jgi:cardiolipin synthase A/B
MIYEARVKSVKSGLGKESEEVWSEEEVFFSGDSFFSSILTGIAKANKSIDVEVYIFELDWLGKRMLDALIQATTRGVKVRLLIDGVGSGLWTQRIDEYLQSTSVDFRVHHPLPWDIAYLLTRYRLTQRILGGFPLFRLLNKRNHRKVWFIDQREVWTGSFNVSSVHLQEFSEQKAWRDTGIKVIGAPLQELRSAFESVWEGGRGTSSEKTNSNASSRILRLNDTRKQRARLYKDILHRFSHAQRKIWITNPYFVPRKSVLRALQRAAWEGADVRLLLPKRADIQFISWIATGFYQSLLPYGVKIFEYLPTGLHAKSVIIDEFAMVGSSNLNHRSLYHDLEVDVVITHPETYRKLADQFREDLKESEEVTILDCQRRPWWIRFFSRVMLSLKYWF